MGRKSLQNENMCQVKNCQSREPTHKVIVELQDYPKKMAYKLCSTHLAVLKDNSVFFMGCSSDETFYVLLKKD
jgi:hypothetical protein